MTGKISIYTLAGLLLTAGCSEQNINEQQKPFMFNREEAKVTENQQVHFVSTSNSFELSPAVVKQIVEILNKAKSQNIENIGFMCVSNQPVANSVHNSVRSQLTSLLMKHGFMSSRIIDSGVCVYKGAQYGIRINMLKYDITEPDCSVWDESIGDIDHDKDMPKFGVAHVYNFEQMIANSADIIAPRTYKGQKAQDAIKATNSGGGGGGSASSGGNSAGL